MTQDERRLLELLLAAGEDGTTDALLREHGRALEVMANMVRAGSRFPRNPVFDLTQSLASGPTSGGVFFADARAWCARGCGIVGADARPNWSERTARPSLTGTQWRG
jgi:hypothetical protein